MRSAHHQFGACGAWPSLVCVRVCQVPHGGVPTVGYVAGPGHAAPSAPCGAGREQTRAGQAPGRGRPVGPHARPWTAPPASAAHVRETPEDRQHTPPSLGARRCRTRRGARRVWARGSAHRGHVAAGKRHATPAPRAWWAPRGPSMHSTRRDASQARAHSIRPWRAPSVTTCGGAGVSRRPRGGALATGLAAIATPAVVAPERAGAGPRAPGAGAGSQEGRTSGTSAVRRGYVGASIGGRCGGTACE